MEKSTQAMKPLYSICIPVYNEAENIKTLVHEITEAMHPYAGAWEIIVVNDGSTDGTKEILKHLKNRQIARYSSYSKIWADGST